MRARREGTPLDGKRKRARLGGPERPLHLEAEIHEVDETETNN